MTTINELIKKYEDKIRYNNQLNQKLIDECQVYAVDLANDNEICEEILKDLKELKEKISDLIQFLPSEEKCRLLDDATYIEYKICDSDFKDILGEVSNE